MRPKGKPQYGWTHGGHMIDLRRKKVYNAKDKLKLVTSEGWDDWYQVEENEFNPKHEQGELFSEHNDTPLLSDRSDHSGQNRHDSQAD